MVRRAVALGGLGADSSTEKTSMKFAPLCAALAAIALAPTFAHAAADDSGFHPLVGALVTYGGDSLATVEFEGGTSRE